MALLSSPVLGTVRTPTYNPLVGPFGFTPFDLFASGESGAWIDPSDLSTLFQNSVGTIPVMASGNTVGLVKDKSGNGIDVSQATSTDRPIYISSGGLQWLQADGVDDFLVNAAFPTDTSWSVLVAAEMITDTFNGRTFGRSVERSIYNNTNQWNWFNVDSGIGTNLGASNVASLMGIDWQSTTVTFPRYNGVEGVSFNPVDTETNNGFALFSDRITGLQFANAKIFQFLIINRTLTSTEWTQLETFFAIKAGVTL